MSPRVLSLFVKTSQCKKKILTPRKLGPNQIVSVIAFRIALKLDVKISWFGRQVAVCVNKRHKNAYLGVVGFKSSTLTEYCLRCLR